MVDVDKLSDGELRTKLLEFGFPVMPITGTTRKVMAKKLKMLLENKNKINSEGGRRSLGRYSSEEESDSDLRSSKKKDNRRATMAAPIMQPPSSNIRVRKSTRLTDVSEPEISGSPLKEVKTTSSTSRTQRIIKTAQDEFDTGSDSESDIISNSYSSGARGISTSFDRNSPIKSSMSSSYSLDTNKYSPKPLESSYSSAKNVSFNANVSPGRLSSYNSPSLASEYATDRLNQIRSRLSLNNSGYDQPIYNSPAPVDKEETPFLSNFTKRLTALSSQKNDYDYKNDIIKEHDTNGSSNYVRNQLSGFRAARGRDSYNYKTSQSNILKNNIVSFAVLGFAALFFIGLAIIYLGMRSDTSIVPAGTVIPHCIHSDPMTKKGVNCVSEEDLSNAIHLLNAIKPELQKRAVANKCFDATLKAHMTEPEVVSFLKTNFAIKDDEQIKNDLLNLEILTFSNPEWGINVVQTEDNNGQVSNDDTVENMEKVIFNYKHKITSLVMFNPELPWKCTFYNTFTTTLKSSLIIGTFFAFFYALNIVIKYYKHYEQKQKDEIGFMVEKIIDILQSSANEENDENFVVINHVRDMILPVADRKRKEKSWIQAVKFINENESRVRTEIQVVKGEPFEVWRWIGSANLSTSGDYSEYIYRQGRRIVDVQYLITEVLKFPHKRLRFCRNWDVEIKNEVREGFISVLLLYCKKCKSEYPVCSEDPNSELIDANLAFVAGIVSLRLNLYQLNELCSSLHIPAISGESYIKYLDEIFEIYNKSISEMDDTNETSSKTSLPDNFDLSTLNKSIEKRVLRSSTPKYEQKLDITKEEFLKELELTLEEIKKLSQLTKNQSKDSLWREERSKRLSASSFGKIYKLLNTTDRNKVARTVLRINPETKHMKYGREHEPIALQEFEIYIGQKINSCGLFVHPDYPFLSATPDGLLGDDTVVEIKCPFNSKDLSLLDAVKRNLVNFISFVDGRCTLKRIHQYYYQVQGQLFVTGREFCYFVVWSPHGMVYEKIEKDYDCWKEMFPKLKEFYFDHLLPVILEERNFVI